MFIAAFFVTAPKWKQPRCPSAADGRNRLVYPCKGGVAIREMKYG